MNLLLDKIILLPILAFASFRVSELLVLDQGPSNLFVRFRTFLGKGASNNKIKFELAELFNCPFCIGVWTSLFFTIFLLPLGFFEFIVCWLSITGMQSFLQSMVGKRSNYLDDE